MESGYLIDNYLELIRFDKRYNIYISRKSLKHFVESRKKEMFDSHTQDGILKKLYYAIDNVILTYTDYDKLEAGGLTRLIYTKHFTESSDHSLRIVLDSFINRYEICSIHFKKRKTPP